MPLPEDPNKQKRMVSIFTDTILRIGIIAVIVVLCLQIFAPFLGIMLWALILAVALYPLHLMLAKKCKNKQGLTATIIVVCGLLILGVPTLLMGNAFADHLHGIFNNVQQGTVSIAPPKESVADWPIIGERVYSIWQSAATDLPDLIANSKDKLNEISKTILGVAKATLGSLFTFIGALIIAGIMMAYGQSGTEAMRKIFIRFSNQEKGTSLHALSVATIRSVATGVIGVAFIQALLLGMGFLFSGIPGAGILAIIVMVFGILQLPAALIFIPAIVYLWMGGDASTTSNIVFSIYFVIAGLADNFLKPLLLGRGVDAPMPVILLGAIGGMVTAGIIGLFIGAVLLAVGYQIFMDWVEQATIDEDNVGTNVEANKE